MSDLLDALIIIGTTPEAIEAIQAYSKARAGLKPDNFSGRLRQAKIPVAVTEVTVLMVAQVHSNQNLLLVELARWKVLPRDENPLRCIAR